MKLLGQFHIYFIYSLKTKGGSQGERLYILSRSHMTKMAAMPWGGGGENVYIFCQGHI